MSILTMRMYLYYDLIGLNMAEQTHLTSPTIRKQWEEWMRPYTYCPGCDMSWPSWYMAEEIPCTCTLEEEK